MSPPIPCATYRLQLTPRFGFEEAAAIVRYLKSLGITHIYASPFLKSRSGSTHGYDVVDYSAINPELGGEGGFGRLTQALAVADMGLILDFVPNHMAVHGADNPWWLDVLERGPQSRYAEFFDIDWHAPPYRRRGRIVVPVLGRPYAEELEAGHIELRYDATEGSFSAWYHEHRFPIAPDCYGAILRSAVALAAARNTPAGSRLLELAAAHTAQSHCRDAMSDVKSELAAVEGAGAIVRQGLAAYRVAAGQPGAIRKLHLLLERQHYRLTWWCLAATEINYRRFFDIASLAGLVPENAAAFKAMHRAVQRLIARGEIQGLRLDHIDGLRDPVAYCRALLRLTNPDGAVDGRHLYVVVEKILADGERLPEFPGVVGTTGYECLHVISRVLLDERGQSALDRTWRQSSGDERAFDAVLTAAKRHVLRTILASEFAALSRLLARMAVGGYKSRDYGAENLTAALELYILCFPIYRTYIGSAGASARDRRIIDETIARVRPLWSGPQTIFDFLRAASTLDLVATGRRGYSITQVRRFSQKLQQFTGPLMAKSLEDTAFYRYHRMLALNEVGGNPAAWGLSVSDFHDRMIDRVATAPHGLTATATHDTKRGEDARARLLALSEIAEDWAHAVSHWRDLNAGVVKSAGGSRAPSAVHEYLLYQALLGAWPLHDFGRDFVDRAKAFAIKAAREGKEQTDWLSPNAVYEADLCDFLDRILDHHVSGLFIASFDALARRAALMGALKSLAQVVLKTTMPGVPDFYQGTEFWDTSFVDPDNRRPVDFAARQSALQGVPEKDIPWRDLVQTWPDGRIKLAVTRCLLAFRKELANVFTQGDYRPAEISGKHCDEVLAFVRSGGRDAAIVVAARLVGRASNYGRRWPTGEAWEGSIAVEGFSSLRNIFTAQTIESRSELDLSELLDVMPVAVLQARGTAVD
jgi:(1->4)-alpha-D-glucan 1-alpha-D-glucosylmutase